MSEPSWTWKNDTMPGVQPAGWAKPDHSGSAADCMKAEALNSARPGTPEEYKKWRKSAHNQPGQRVLHPGLADVSFDVNQRFGKVGDKTTSAKTLLDSGVTSSLRSFMDQQKEAVYKPKPLGCTRPLDKELPQSVKDGSQAFGVQSDLSEAALKVIFPEGPQPAAKDDGIGRSAGRHYDWQRVGINPDETRFGKKANGLEPGISEVLCQITTGSTLAPKEVVDAHRAKKPQLGATRTAPSIIQQLPEGHTFGAKPRSGDEWNAARCIQASYGDMGDGNVGKCSSQGWAAPPEAAHQVHGVTSVRTDRVIPVQKRSVANTTNFGDEGGARGALMPSAHEANGLSDADFDGERSPAELRAITQAAGWNLDAARFEQLAQEARRVNGKLSVNTVRAAYNRLVLGL